MVSVVSSLNLNYYQCVSERPSTKEIVSANSLSHDMMRFMFSISRHGKRYMMCGTIVFVFKFTTAIIFLRKGLFRIYFMFEGNE